MPLSVEMHSGHWTVDAADVLCIQVAMTSLWFTVDSWCSWCVVYAGCNDVLVVYCGLLMQLMCCVYRLQWRPCGLLWTVDADDVLSMQVAMTSLWFTVVSWCSWCVVYTGCNDVLVVYCGQLMQLMCCVYRLQWRPCGSRWVWQSADACRHGWKVWPQDTRMAAITGSFICQHSFHHLHFVVSMMSRCNHINNAVIERSLLDDVIMSNAKGA